MRLIMLGTGPFAVPTLEALYKSSHNVAALVTQPPRPMRGVRQPAENPLRTLARQHGTPVFDPPDINAADAQTQLAALGPDLLVVADYGQILSASTIGLARHGTINLHGSLLPKYRGAAPVQWAVYHGETETGVSVFQVTPAVDAGPLLATATTAIDPDETAGELESRLARLGAPLVVRSIDALARGELPRAPQDDRAASRARRLRKSDGAIDWSRSARAIYNQVRALEPWPRTYTYWLREEGQPLRLILGRVRVVDQAADAPPGTVLEAADSLIVATGAGRLAIDSLQPAGGRLQPAETLLRGHPIHAGARLGAAD